ncbi:acetyl esterase [Nocardioides luteus]|nr:alpha/beta hydrolase [Nocardioides luteus]MDR7312051.1 acetyl esterase [Nocardioides luteus]
MLPLRTRIFAFLQQRLMKSPLTAEEMIALRAQREGFRTGPITALLFGRPADVETKETYVDGRRYAVYTPRGLNGPAPVVINFHGGGWCLGTPEQSAWVSSHVAARTGSIVVAPTYRLAPEHPFPAAVEDAWAAVEWVAKHAADLGGDPGRISVMGDSAGGNLATVVALMARDAGGPAIESQVLIYPAVEMYEKFPSEAANANGPVLTSTQMSTFSHLYMGSSYGDESWQASPLRATSHADLPPTLIITALHDPIRDHGTRYAEALRAAGTEVTLVDYDTAFHGFMSLPGVAPAAKKALAGIAEFLRSLPR